jgi:hypothetical protein
LNQYVVEYNGERNGKKVVGVVVLEANCGPNAITRARGLITTEGSIRINHITYHKIRPYRAYSFKEEWEVESSAE